MELCGGPSDLSNFNFILLILFFFFAVLLTFILIHPPKKRHVFIAVTDCNFSKTY